jgi:hypothetical protein
MAMINACLYAYMKVYHRLEVVRLSGELPSPPLIVLTNHVSALDGVAFIIANPYVGLAPVGKASLLNVPIVGQVLRNWGMIPGRTLARCEISCGAFTTGVQSESPLRGRAIAPVALGTYIVYWRSWPLASKCPSCLRLLEGHTKHCRLVPGFLYLSLSRSSSVDLSRSANCMASHGMKPSNVHGSLFASTLSHCLTMQNYKASS